MCKEKVKGRRLASPLSLLLLVYLDAEVLGAGDGRERRTKRIVGVVHVVPPLVTIDADGVPLRHVLVRDEIPSVAGVDTGAKLVAEGVKLLPDVVEPVGDGYYG